MNIYKYYIQTSHLKICINAYLKKLKRKYGLVFLLKERYIIYIVSNSSKLVHTMN